MTPPTAIQTPPSEPVLLTIGRRPADGPTGVLPVPMTTVLIKDDEFQIVADLDEAAEGAEHVGHPGLRRGPPDAGR